MLEGFYESTPGSMWGLATSFSTSMCYSPFEPRAISESSFSDTLLKLFSDEIYSIKWPGIVCMFVFLGLTAFLNICGHITTVPACSSGILTNMLPHRNVMPQTQGMTPHPTPLQYRPTWPICRCVIHWLLVGSSVERTIATGS